MASAPARHTRTRALASPWRQRRWPCAGVYAGRVSQLAEAGNNHAYEEAARLVAPVQKHDPGSGYGANAVPGL